MIEIARPTIKIEGEVAREGTFLIEPLERGYGTTLGNALRRVLYTALPGAAIIGIKIDGVKHEFDTIPGVREDVAEIILNLKEIAIKVHPYESFTKANVKLEKSGEGIVRASDIKISSDIEIMNPDAYICSLSDGAKLNMEITIGKGKGYVSANNNKLDHAPIGYIPIDSLFSPVQSVSYHVSDTRVEQTIDYDKLAITVKTNATSTPREVVSLAAKILVDHLRLFMVLDENMSKIETIVEATTEVEPEKLNIPIENLELSVRPLNCLKRYKINFLDELLALTEEELARIKNLGKKSADEIIEKLTLQGYSLKKND